jgi:AcrR family transcriptional regulator
VASKPRSPAVSTGLPGGNRRGRPSAARVAAIEDDILDAAHALFLELGYEAASMEGVTERAGVSKGTLYARYTGKEAVFRAVIRKRLDIWSAHAGAQDHLLPRELRPRLMHHARTLARMFAWPEYRQTSKLIQTAAISFPDVAVYWHEQGTRKFITFLAEDMASVFEPKGGESPDWPFLAGLFLHGFSGWYALEESVGPISEERTDTFARHLIDTILAAVTAHDNPQI